MIDNSNVVVKIEDILLSVTHSVTGCCYSILNLGAVFPNGAGQPVDNIFHEISKNKFGYIITPDNLNILASKAGDLWSMMLVAYQSQDALIKRANAQDWHVIIDDAYFYMEITDGQVFEIRCKDPYIDTKLKSEFENTYVLSDL